VYPSTFVPWFADDRGAPAVLRALWPGIADRYADGDFSGAYAITRHAYTHMAVIGGALATAIAAQFPERFPDPTVMPAASPGRSLAVAAGWLLVAGIVAGGLLVHHAARRRMSA
jgi:hypothetical protein